MVAIEETFFAQIIDHGFNGSFDITDISQYL